MSTENTQGQQQESGQPLQEEVKDDNNHDNNNNEGINVNNNNNGDERKLNDNYNNNNNMNGNHDDYIDDDDFEEMQYNHFNNNNNNNEIENDTILMNDNSEYDKKLYEIYGKITRIQNNYPQMKKIVTEVIIIGKQSSGKSTLLSVLLRIPANYMSDETASRRPVRYILIKSKNGKKDYEISVENKKVQSFKEMLNLISNEMEKLKNNKDSQFSNKPLNVRISHDNISHDCILIDLPGLVGNDEGKYKDYKTQLWDMTFSFLSKKVEDNEGRQVFQYMPIVVRAANDIGHDTSIKEIDDQIKSIRPNWKKEALFVINQLDNKFNFPNAKEFIHTINELKRYGDTVFTIMNPTRKNVSKMTGDELSHFIKNVENVENRFIQTKIMPQYKNDPNLRALQNVFKTCVGVKMMKQKIKSKMLYDVKNKISEVPKLLESFTIELNKRIEDLEKQIELNNPQKLCYYVSTFIRKWLQEMRLFYNGEGTYIHYLKKLTWNDEMNEFELLYTLNNDSLYWKNKYYLNYDHLKSLLIQLNPKLYKEIITPIHGGKLTLRILDVWKFMISSMKLKKFNQSDLYTMTNPFSSTITGMPEDLLRNILDNGVSNLKFGIEWLKLLLQYRLLKNADDIFDLMFQDEFGNANINIKNNRNNNQQKYDNYKIEIFDNICKEHLTIYKEAVQEFLNNFLNVAEILPENYTKSIDLSLKCQFEGLTKIFAIQNNNNNNISDNNNKDVMPTIIINDEKENEQENSVDIYDEKYDNNNNNNNDELIIDNLDLNFYEKVYCITNDRLNDNDCTYILQRASQEFQFIKFDIIKATQYKLTYHIMHPIRQDDNNNILIDYVMKGVGEQKIQLAINNMYELTGVNIKALEECIYNGKNKKLTKGIEKMNNDDIKSFAIIDINKINEDLIHLKQERNNYLNESKDLKKSIQELTFLCQ